MLPEREFENSLNDRRFFLKLLAAAPLFATIAIGSAGRSFAGLETQAGRPSLFCNTHIRDPARRKLPGMTAKWNARRVTKEKESRLLHFRGRNRLLTPFGSYHYYRSPSNPFA
jgi:hypothetical protein